MKPNSLVNKYFTTFRKFFNNANPKSRFISDSTGFKNGLSYLNLLTEKEKINYFSKTDTNHTSDLTKDDTFFHFINNYKNKVRDLDSRVRHIESFYRSRSDPPYELEYEVIGSYAYYLKQSHDSMCLLRTNLLPFKGHRRGCLFTDFILGNGEKLIDFSKLESQGVSNVKKLRISPGGDLISILYDSDLNDMCKVIFYSISKGILFNNTLDDVGEIYFMPYPKNLSFVRVYYTQLNPQRRSDKLFTSLVHVKSGALCCKRLLHLEPVNFISLFKSKSGDVLFMANTSYNKLFSAFMINWNSKMYRIPTLNNSKIFLEHRRGSVYCIYSSVISQIIRIPVYSLRPYRSSENVDNVGIDDRNTIILNYMVTDIDMFDSGLVLYLLKPPSSPKMAILKFNGSSVRKNHETIQKNRDDSLVMVEIPVQVGVIEPAINLDYFTGSFKLNLNSPGLQKFPLEVDLETCSFKDLTNIDSSLKSFVLEVPSTDGNCKIPLTIVAKGDDILGIRDIGCRKCLLCVYGFYGENLTVSNHLEHGPLLDMGYVICFAHVRGGGELGEEWQNMGNKVNKHNSLYDLIDVIQFIIAKNITSRSFLALSVSSASGILGGCIYNMRPDLCSVIIFKLPYLDLLTTATDTSQPLVELEYEEFGRSSDYVQKEHILDHIYSLDPCSNVKKNRTKKPALIINCDERDIRAPWYHTAKFVSMVRENDDNQLIFVNLSNHGHDGIPPYHHLIRTCSEEISLIDHFLGENTLVNT